VRGTTRARRHRAERFAAASAAAPVRPARRQQKTAFRSGEPWPAPTIQRGCCLPPPVHSAAAHLVSTGSNRLAALATAARRSASPPSWRSARLTSSVARGRATMALASRAAIDATLVPLASDISGGARPRPPPRPPPPPPPPHAPPPP